MEILKRIAKYTLRAIWLVLAVAVIYSYLNADVMSETSQNMWLFFAIITFIIGVCTLVDTELTPAEFMNRYPTKPSRYWLITSTVIWVIFWFVVARFIPITAVFGLMGQLMWAGHKQQVIEKWDGAFKQYQAYEEHQERLDAQQRQG